MFELKGRYKYIQDRITLNTEHKMSAIDLFYGNIDHGLTEQNESIRKEREFLTAVKSTRRSRDRDPKNEKPHKPRGNDRSQTRYQSRSPHSSSRSQKRLFHQEYDSQQVSGRHSGSPEIQRPQTHPHVHTVKRQLLGRPPQQTHQQARLETESQIFRMDSTTLQETQCRCIRIPHKSPCKEVVFTPPGTRISRSQCIRPRLVDRTSPLHQRPMGSHSTDPTKNTELTEYTTTDISTSSVENQSLVATVTRVWVAYVVVLLPLKMQHSSDYLSL